MTTISVRLGEEDRRNLKAIQKATGWSASRALRESLQTKRDLIAETAPLKKSGADLYSEIMAQSEGERSEPPTDDARHVSERVRAIIEAKHKRRSARR
ncbi:MAG: hypothetical protein ACOZAA_14875 [Pseudomonadota bacterium]